MHAFQYDNIGIDNNKKALAGGDDSSVPVIQQAVIIITGVGTGGAWGAATPPECWMQGAVPPYKFALMGLGNKV